MSEKQFPQMSRTEANLVSYILSFAGTHQSTQSMTVLCVSKTDALNKLHLIKEVLVSGDVRFYINWDMYTLLLKGHIFLFKFHSDQLRGMQAEGWVIDEFHGRERRMDHNLLVQLIEYYKKVEYSKTLT